ncbi:MAG: hypothetical protein ABWK01_08545 [Infirmifilum sp.]
MKRVKVFYILLSLLAVASALTYDVLGILFFWTIAWISLVALALLFLVEAYGRRLPAHRPSPKTEEEEYEGLLEETRKKIASGNKVGIEELEKRIFYFSSE